MVLVVDGNSSLEKIRHSGWLIAASLPIADQTTAFFQRNRQVSMACTIRVFADGTTLAQRKEESILKLAYCCNSSSQRITVLAATSIFLSDIRENMGLLCSFSLLTLISPLAT